MIYVSPPGRLADHLWGRTNTHRTMRTITSILVPTDFSSVALNAYKYALHLADELGASVDLLYAIPLSAVSPDYGTLVDTLLVKLEEDARREMDDFMARGLAAVAGDLKGVPAVASFVELNDLRSALGRHVRQQHNQLLVMGTAGKRDGWEDFLGTNASHLITYAPCPVLVVPPRAAYKPIAAVCFATDLHDVATFQAGRLLHSLRPYRPRLHFLHVRQDKHERTDYDLDLLREVFDRPEAGLRATFADRPAEDLVGALFSYAAEHDCAWVVMHRPDRSWFRRLLIKSSTGEAVKRARLPLLILSAEDLVAGDAPLPTATSTVTTAR